MAKKTKRKPRRKVKRKRKVRRKVERYAGRTEEEWRDWGEKFGKRMDKVGREFGEEMEDLGERFGRHMERRSKRWERRWKNWWFRTFDVIGPIIKSVFGIVFVVFGILMLNLINLPFGSDFIAAVSSFLFTNLHWFFAAFLIFGYSDYFSEKYPRTYWIISPIANSIGVIIVVWISIWMLNLINTSVGSSVIAAISNFLHANLLAIFVLSLMLGYVVVIIKEFIIDVLKF